MSLYIYIIFTYEYLQPGRLKKVQAIGWYLEESNMAQVSVNIVDHDVTPMHVVYEEICKDAKVIINLITSILQKSWLHLSVVHHNNQNNNLCSIGKFRINS